MTARSKAPWKHHPNARTCAYCGSQRPGMQPLRLFDKDGRGPAKRGYWHLECFEKAKAELRAKR